jgi:hypothetical protein
MGYLLSEKDRAKLSEVISWYQQNKGRLGMFFRRNPRLQSAPVIGGGGSSATRGIVIATPTFQDPYAAVGTTEYAGQGYYVIRPDGTTYDDWVTGTIYALNAKVRDNYDNKNRVYIMSQSDPEAFNPELAPHENPADWTLFDEIRIDYASCQYNRTTESGKAIKDCTPIFTIGSSVKYTSFTKSDTSVIYLLDETVSYVGMPGDRTITMYEDAIVAVFQ